MPRQTPQQRLIKWFTAHGGTINSSITLSQDDESGQHFRATESLNIALDSAIQVCKCPFALTLSHLNLLSSPPPAIQAHCDQSICTKLLDKIPIAAVSYFFLVEQRLKGADSWWEPYISALPKEEEMNTPLWFEKDDLLWLLGTTMASGKDPSQYGVELRREMWKDQWREGVRCLEEAGDDVKQFSWELYLWAATIFTSRSFTSDIVMQSKTDSFAVLYPAIDSFNHQFGAKVLWDMNKGDFSLKLTQPIKAGDEIYNNYAPKGNQELLMGYGFCIPDNPCDEVAIRLGRPPEQVHIALQKKFPHRFSSTEWIPEDATFHLRGSKHFTGGYSKENTLPCLRGLPPDFYNTILTILSFAFEAQSQEDGSEMSADEVQDAALDAIVERLLEKQNAIEQWTSQLPAQPQNIRQRYAKMYRDGQLAILKEIIGEINACLQRD